MSKKILIIILPLVIIVALLASNYSSVNEIEDAAVNAENGDVAFVYYDSKLDGYHLKCYDCNGTLLFHEVYYVSGGGIYLEYADSLLHIYVGRTSMYYAVDRGGNHIKAISDFDRNSQLGKTLINEYWNDWEKDGRILSCSSVGKNYCYEKSSIIKRLLKKGYVAFYIRDEQGNMIELYRDSQ